MDPADLLYHIPGYNLECDMDLVQSYTQELLEAEKDHDAFHSFVSRWRQVFLTPTPKGIGATPQDLDDPQKIETARQYIQRARDNSEVEPDALALEILIPLLFLTASLVGKKYRVSLGVAMAQVTRAAHQGSHATPQTY